jgi:hypothetical protein
VRAYPPAGGFYERLLRLPGMTLCRGEKYLGGLAGPPGGLAVVLD